ncbi:MAG: MBL fold metallo-hydrolase [Pseudomonadota bacterium]
MPLKRRAFVGSLATFALPLLAQPVPLRLRQLAAHIHVLEAHNAEPNADNGGLVVNTGIITGPRGALVVDPGAHASAGRALAHTVESELGMPIVGIINTHAHPEHVLGNAAFAHLPIYASAQTRRLMQRRCQMCLKALIRLVGAQVMRQTRIVLPNKTLAPGGNVAIMGQRFSVKVFTHAHSQGDLALFEPRSGVMFGGGLAYRERIPEMQEASVYGWLTALRQCQEWPVSQFVGAGVGTAEQTMDTTYHYLAKLASTVANQIRSGGDVNSVAADPTGPWQQWIGYDKRHPLNVQHVWQELEALWWSGNLP